MFTLIGLGVSVAYVYSAVATFLPDLFPASFRGAGGQVSVYFEAAASITTLVFWGQVLELRARGQASAAIKALLGLAPNGIGITGEMNPSAIAGKLMALLRCHFLPVRSEIRF